VALTVTGWHGNLKVQWHCQPVALSKPPPRQWPGHCHCPSLRRPGTQRAGGSVTHCDCPLPSLRRGGRRERYKCRRLGVPASPANRNQAARRRARAASSGPTGPGPGRRGPCAGSLSVTVRGCRPQRLGAGLAASSSGFGSTRCWPDRGSTVVVRAVPVVRARPNVVKVLTSVIFLAVCHFFLAGLDLSRKVQIGIGHRSV
jgi:hypothetical protein